MSTAYCGVDGCPDRDVGPHDHPEVIPGFPFMVKPSQGVTEDPDPVMWQRVAYMEDGTRILITCYDNDCDTLEVCTRPPYTDRWSPPLVVVDPP